MHIFLIRHGESIANNGENYIKRIPDHLVTLSDYEKHGIDTLFIFTHGTTLRAFLLRWFHYSPEWFHKEKNPKNCWIREIKEHKDYGYINI